MSEDEVPAKKSKPSTHPVELVFYNRTKRLVSAVWLNYEGIGVLYHRLLPSSMITINTYAGHPWIFVDAKTGDKLASYVAQGPEDSTMRRIVIIRIPVYSLKERCLQILRQYLTLNALPDLELPSTLKDDLRVRLENYSMFCSGHHLRDDVSSSDEHHN